MFCTITTRFPPSYQSPFINPPTQPNPPQVMDPFAILQRARSFTSVIRTTRPGLTSEELETVALCTVVAASELKAVCICVRGKGYGWDCVCWGRSGMGRNVRGCD